MNLKEQLIAMQIEAMQKAKNVLETIGEEEKVTTEHFFDQVKQSLTSKFEMNPTTGIVSMSLSSKRDNNYNDIVNLYKNGLLNVDYLQLLCQTDGINLRFSVREDGTPIFNFFLHLLKQKKADYQETQFRFGMHR